MGTWYTLFNFTKREQLSIGKVSGMKKWEILSTPVASTLITLYLFDNAGDAISIIGDDSIDETFVAFGKSWSAADVYAWPNCFERVVAAGVSLEVLEDHGKNFAYDNDPELYERDIRLPRADGDVSSR